MLEQYLTFLMMCLRSNTRFMFSFLYIRWYVLYSHNESLYFVGSCFLMCLYSYFLTIIVLRLAYPRLEKRRNSSPARDGEKWHGPNPVESHEPRLHAQRHQPRIREARGALPAAQLAENLGAIDAPFIRKRRARCRKMNANFSIETCIVGLDT